MRLDRLTIKAQEAVQDAQRLADTHHHQQIDVEHLALALIQQPDGLVPALLKKLGSNHQALAQTLEKEINRMPQVTGPGITGQVYISPRLKSVLDQAQQEAEQLKDE